MATEHLLAQGWALRAASPGPRSAQTAILRRHGYQEALRRPGSARRVAHEAFTIDGGRAATARLLGNARAPDGCSRQRRPGDGVLQELRRHGLRAGCDVGLVCFDDSPWAPFIDPPISVIAQDPYRMGTNATSMLIGRIGGATHPPASPRARGRSCGAGELVASLTDRPRARRRSRCGVGGASQL